MILLPGFSNNIALASIDDGGERELNTFGAVSNSDSFVVVESAFMQVAAEVVVDVISSVVLGSGRGRIVLVVVKITYCRYVGVLIYR